MQHKDRFIHKKTREERKLLTSGVYLTE